MNDFLSPFFFFQFLFPCSSYSLPFFFFNYPACAGTPQPMHKHGQVTVRATELADLAQGMHKKWHIYFDRAFKWAKTSSKASHWQTDAAGKSLWASGCALPPTKMLHTLVNTTLATWQLGKARRIDTAVFLKPVLALSKKSLYSLTSYETGL